MSNAPGNDSLAVSFMHIKLRRESKEDYMKMDENERGIGL